ELIGSDTCTALGITSRSSTPVLEMCRRLIKAGCDPHRPLWAYRANTLAVIVAKIGQGAQLEINPKGTGFISHRACAQGRPCIKTAGGVMSARRQRLPIGCALDHLIAAGGKS